MGVVGVSGRWELDEDGGMPREDVGVRVDERARMGLAARWVGVVGELGRLPRGR